MLSNMVDKPAGDVDNSIVPGSPLGALVAWGEDARPLGRS